MRRIPIYALQPGMKVARPVWGPEGQVLLQRDMILTRRYITQLKNLGLGFLYIDDGLLGNHDVADVVRDETRVQAVQRVRNLVSAVETPNPASHVLLRTQQAQKTVHDIIGDLLSERKLMVNLVDIRLEDDYLFNHSVNVCILSLITGINMGMNKSQLTQLGVGAMMHDVGKGVMPHNILYKDSSLTPSEFEIMKTHTSKGAELLHAMSDGQVVALEHHERYDGQGYPHGKSGSQINVHAQVAAICDVYDAVTSSRIYRKAYPPHEAIELISASGNQSFRLELVHKFLENIAAYPTGTIVELADKRVGIVIETPPKQSRYPRVKLLFDEEKQPIKRYTVVSTLDAPSFNVRRVLTEEEFITLRGMA